MATLIPLNIRNGLAYMDMRALMLTGTPKSWTVNLIQMRHGKMHKMSPHLLTLILMRLAITCNVTLLSLMPTLAIKNSLI